MSVASLLLSQPARMTSFGTARSSCALRFVLAASCFQKFSIQTCFGQMFCPSASLLAPACLRRGLGRRFGRGSGVVRAACGSGAVRARFGLGSRGWFGLGSGGWFGRGSGAVRARFGRAWFGRSSGAVRAWFGRGSGAVRAWFGRGSGAVRAWFGRRVLRARFGRGSGGCGSGAVRARFGSLLFHSLTIKDSFAEIGQNHQNHGC